MDSWFVIGLLVWAYLVMGAIIDMLLFFSYNIDRPKAWHYVVAFLFWPLIALVMGVIITYYFFKFVVYEPLTGRRSDNKS